MTITQGVAELRNYYGAGHGKVATSNDLRPCIASTTIRLIRTRASVGLEYLPRMQSALERVCLIWLSVADALSASYWGALSGRHVSI
ncbi:abortive infection family protein [Paraburkholderia nemoris]|uniref:abortive infection family protein n=1 Tax=Paraburkholderia nemoris TaxID=2793076 RepID=UPI0038B7F09B